MKYAPEVSEIKQFVKGEETLSSLEAEIFALRMQMPADVPHAPQNSPHLNNFTMGDGYIEITPQRLPADVLNKVLTAENGNQYKINRNGQVTEFTYMDNGNVVQTITNVRRDMDGYVVEFTDRDGTNWVKQHRDPDNGKWYAKNSTDTSAFYVPVDLGEVTLHADGLHISGNDRAKVYLPSK